MISLKQPSFWQKTPKSFIDKLLPYLLLPLSWLYRLGFFIHQKRSKLLNCQSLPKIICVGNATAGGSGKTPTVDFIYKAMLENNYFKNPVMMMKGYRGKIKHPTIVDVQQHNVIDVGDEAYMMASKSYPVIVSNCRKAGIIFAKEQDYDLVIMDDGLQNPIIKADISLCVIDNGFGFGNCLMLPAGPLRQPLSWLHDHVDAFILIGNNDGSAANINIPHSSASFYGSFELSSPQATEENIQYLAFAGIGRPQKFYDSLKLAGFNVTATKSFPDHHAYTEQDIKTLIRNAQDQKLRLITTEKDAVKINQEIMKNIDVAPAFLSIKSQDQLIQLIKEKLSKLDQHI